MTDYAEFAVTTNFSFLRGASHAEELVEHAAELGLAGIGIADRNTFAGDYDVLFRSYPSIDSSRFPVERQIVCIPDLQQDTYPEFFKHARLLAYDKFLLCMLIVGAAFLIGAIIAARVGQFPRTDASGATLAGAILLVLSGMLFFTRLVAIASVSG